jgi:hypothetical protein
MIPRVIHFIWINKTQDFDAGEYASVLSALMNTSYKVVLHTNLGARDLKSKYNPYKLLSSWRTRFKINQMNFEDTFEGVKARMANISDIYRILLLYKYGGMYSDLDMFWFKDLVLDDGSDPLKTHNYIVAWENPSYKTVQNAWMAMAKGFKPAASLLEDFRESFRRLAAKGRTDISTSRDLKDHMLLYHPTSAFAKTKSDLIIGKKYFFKNGWRRFGRVMTRLKLPMRFNNRDYGTTKDEIQVDDVVGIHYGNYLYPYESVIRIPAIREKMADVLGEMP